MHMVVVGGGPTGVEYAGELHDFLIASLALLLPLSSLTLDAFIGRFAKVVP
jgi:NADH dehydrogenase FAD-containing subunit